MGRLTNSLWRALPRAIAAVAALTAAIAVNADGAAASTSHAKAAAHTTASEHAKTAKHGKKKTKPSKSNPPYYTLKGAKRKCRVNYTKQAITITYRKHHRTIHEHETRCVYTGSKGANGATVSFPSSLPTAAIVVTVIPKAADASYTIPAGDTLVVGGDGVLTGNSDSGVTAELVSATAHGTITLNHDGTFRYLPATSFSGVDTFTYRTVSSSGESSTPATVTIHVTPLAAAVGAYTLPISGALSVAAPGVLTGDSGSGLTAKLVSGPSAGLLTLNPDGSFTYTPTPGFAGSDSFSFEAVDSSGQDSNAVSVTIEIGAQAPRVLPQAFAGAIRNTELQVGGSRGPGPEVYDSAGSALAGDSDPAGGTLATTPATITTAEGGTVTLAADGSFSYQPPTGFNGSSDSFTYEVDTSEGTSAQATATIEFDPEDIGVLYVNNTAPAGGDGSSLAPFDSLATALAAAAPNDVVFLFGSSTPYAGGETLPTDVTVVGQPAGLSVDAEDLVDPSSGSPAAQITSSGAGLTLTDGDELNTLSIEHPSGDGVDLSSGTFTIENLTITDAGGDGINVSGNADVTVNGSTITGSGQDGIYIDGGSGSALQGFAVENNTITGSQHAAVSLTYAADANGNVDNNTIGIGASGHGTTTAGSGSQSADGIDLTAAGASAWLYADVWDNAVYGVAEGTGVDADASGGGTLELPLTNNAIYTDATATGNGVTISAGESSSDPGSVCVDPGLNTVTAKGTATNAIELEEPDSSSVFGIQGYTGGPSYSGVAALLTTNNTLSAPGGGALALATPSGGAFTNCTVQEPSI